jgi:hypothetical protein
VACRASAHQKAQAAGAWLREPTCVDLLGQSREVVDDDMDSGPLARRGVLDELPFADDTEMLGYRFPVDIEMTPLGRKPFVR